MPTISEELQQLKEMPTSAPSPEVKEAVESLKAELAEIMKIYGAFYNFEALCRYILLNESIADLLTAPVLSYLFSHPEGRREYIYTIGAKTLTLTRFIEVGFSNDLVGMAARNKPDDVALDLLEQYECNTLRIYDQIQEVLLGNMLETYDVLQNHLSSYKAPHPPISPDEASQQPLFSTPTRRSSERPPLLSMTQ
ncbi:MAG: hypothetical protein NTW08_07660 [Gammaproteobacteria bacterium]|nr:hypothetical protein [Gammaproteobacteria bacterium]